MNILSLLRAKKPVEKFYPAGTGMVRDKNGRIIRLPKGNPGQTVVKGI